MLKNSRSDSAKNDVFTIGSNRPFADTSTSYTYTHTADQQFKLYGLESWSVSGYLTGFKFIEFDRSSYDTAKSTFTTESAKIAPAELAKTTAETDLNDAIAAAIINENDRIFEAEQTQIKNELTTIVLDKENTEIDLIADAFETSRQQAVLVATSVAADDSQIPGQTKELLVNEANVADQRATQSRQTILDTLTAQDQIAADIYSQRVIELATIQSKQYETQAALDRATNYLENQGIYKSDLEWTIDQVPLVEALTTKQQRQFDSVEYEWQQKQKAVEKLNSDLTSLKE